MAFTDFYEAIQSLRNTDDIPVALDAVRMQLKLSEPLTIEQLYALLIIVVKQQIMDTAKADITLMSLGLLKGYEYQNTKIGERRDKFLQESDYFENLYHGKYQSYDEAKHSFGSSKSGIATVKDGLDSREKNYIRPVAKWIYAHPKETTKLIEQIKKSPEQYFIIQKTENDKDKYLPILPELIHKKAESDVPAPERQPTSTNDGKKDNASSPFVMRLRQIPGSTWVSLGCLILCAVSVTLYLVLPWYFAQQSNVIQHISVSNSSVVLSPGEYAPLYISVYAETSKLDPDWDALQCHSNDAPLITTAKASDWAESKTWTTAWNVLAARDWAADLPYSGSVTVEGGKAEAVTVPVTVVDAADSSYEAYLPEPPERVDSGDAITP